MANNPMEDDRHIVDSFQFLGKRGVRRIDGYKKAIGQSVYTKDIHLPGMLYAKFLTSPHAYARIVRLDTRKAEAVTGVRDILRYDDPEIIGRRTISTNGMEEDTLPGYAYFQGQQVGTFVVADTDDIANIALRLIETEWEGRP